MRIRYATGPYRIIEVVRGLTLLCALAACGRIDFDPRDEAGAGGNDGGDASSLDATDTSLIAYYRFDDDPGDGVLDSTGHGHTGACNPTCPTVVAGKLGGAYELDGVDTGVEVMSAAALEVTPISITAWVFRTLDTPQQSIVTKLYGTTTRNSWQLVVDGGEALMICTTSSPGSGTCSNSGANLVTLNAWTHVAYVYDGTTARGYLRGVEFATSTLPLAYDGRSILIGIDIDNSAFSAPFVGRIDDVRIYGRALSPQEVARLAAGDEL